MFDNWNKWLRNNRIKNMVWTVADNHGLSVGIGGGSSYTDTKRVQVSDVETLVKMGVKEEDAYDSNMYSAAHEGAHVKYTQADALRDTLMQGSKEGMDIETLNALCQIGEDYRIDHITTLDRPGYKDLRENSISTFVSLFGKQRSGNTNFDTTKAISALTYGVDMRTLHDSWEELDWDKIEDASRLIMFGATEAKSTKDVMDTALRTYKQYWDTKPKEDKPEKPEEDDGEGEPEEEGEGVGSDTYGEDKESSKLDKPEDNEDDEESKEYHTSSEEDSDTDGDGVGTEKETKSEEEKKAEEKEISDKIDKMVKESTKSPMEDFMDERAKEKLEYVKRVLEIESRTEEDIEERKKDIKRYIDKNFGKCLWTKEEHEEMERKLCRGIHAGTSLLYCNVRKYDGGILSSSSMYNLDNQARKLANKLREDMKAAKNDEGYLSDNGTVVGSMAYKATKMENNHIFFKPEYDEEGGYAIELLLDASGSQGGRNMSIREQSYIIGMACSMADIPCRITSFRVVQNTTIIELYRDFDDHIESNKKCFSFMAGGDNRDGLAIQTVYEMFKKRTEPNKIFVILSDGDPSDASGKAIIDSAGGLGHYVGNDRKWVGDDTTTAIMDTSRTIRNVRRSGIPLMGIYVGDTGCLGVEKSMFGNDFAYIGNKMDNFVDVVGNYLHKQILKM